MPDGEDRPRRPALDAALAAAVFAVDPAGVGGVALRSAAGPVRDAWMQLARELCPAPAPWRRVPLGIADARLLGGLDLAATLRAGRPVAEHGVLVHCDGGIAVFPMAERLDAGTTARVAAVLDSGVVALERDGFTATLPARLGVIALDEGIGDDERLRPALADRLALHVDLAGVTPDDLAAGAYLPAVVATARKFLADVEADAVVVAALCEAAEALGVDSLRVPLLALRVARITAALGGRVAVNESDAQAAARLVLLPRATRLPPRDEPAEPAPAEDDDASSPPPNAEGEPPPEREAPTDRDIAEIVDVVLAAVRAALPEGLLAQLSCGDAARSKIHSAGRAGAPQAAARRGRPVGTRRGAPARGARLDLIETLRAAAPWQRLRRADAAASAARVCVLPEDFRVKRFRQRTASTTVFAVDASGSAAMHRLAEAKGAVELLLADCYIRRDSVALVAFRGDGAETLLPQTRSLARARRSLAGLPGGGATPLAAGIDAAAALADSLRRKGDAPTLVLLTDGRANIALDGSPGRARAETDALAAARRFRALGIAALLVDTSPRPQPLARDLAQAMGARYLALPHADASTLSSAVRAANAAPLIARGA